MFTDHNYSAELHDWYIDRYPNGYIYWGHIYGDKKARFWDGAKIHTSAVLEEDEYDDFFLITTLNSVYKLPKAYKSELGETTYAEGGGVSRERKDILRIP